MDDVPELAGQLVACPKCGGQFQFPAGFQLISPVRRNTHQSKSAYGLFDFQFRHFITPDYVRTVYFLAFLLVLAGATVVGAVNVFTLMDPGPNPTKAFFGLLAMDLILLVIGLGYLVTVRLACEFIMVVHRSEEHLRAIKDRAI